MSRRGKKTERSTTEKVAIIVVALLIGALTLEGLDIVDVPMVNFSVGGGSSGPSGPGGDGGGSISGNSPCSYPTCTVTSSVSAWDSLDISTTRTIGTDINILWFKYQSGWIKLNSGTAADLPLVAADDDVVYMALQYPGSPSYYIDYQRILDMNTHVSWYGYEDITGDSIEEAVFKVDISGSVFASATGKWTMPNVNAYILTYDSSFSIPAGGQPADITGVGETTTTQYSKWYTEVSAEKKAIALYKVVLSANTSDISKIALKKCYVPGVGYLDGSNFEMDVLTSSIKWSYTLSGNVLYGATYIERPVNDPNEFKFTTAWETNYATNDTIQVTLTLYELSAAEASVTDTDSQCISEA